MSRNLHLKNIYIYIYAKLKKKKKIQHGQIEL